MMAQINEVKGQKTNEAIKQFIYKKGYILGILLSGFKGQNE